MSEQKVETTAGQSSVSRAPQLTDDVAVRFTFPASIEEWADDLIRKSWMDMWVERDQNGALVVEAEVGGNTNGLSVLRSVLAEIEDALDEGDVDPMEFSVYVTAHEHVSPDTATSVKSPPASDSSDGG